jgi:hypothetical protein
MICFSPLSSFGLRFAIATTLFPASTACIMEKQLSLPPDTRAKTRYDGIFLQ